MKNLEKMSEQNREQMRLVAEAHERQRIANEEAMKALLEQSKRAIEDAEKRYKEARDESQRQLAERDKQLAIQQQQFNEALRAQAG